MPTGKLKHPIIKDVDYIDIKRGGTLLKTYGKELNGKTWRKLQELIGKEFGSGKYSYIYKFKSTDELSKGQINGVAMGMPQEEKPESNLELAEIKAAISTLSAKLSESAKGEGGNVSLWVEMTRQNYDSQIRFLNLEIDKRDRTIEKHEVKIETLTVELSETDGETPMFNAVDAFQLITQIAMKKFGVGAADVKLEDSNQSDIPPGILQLIGMVDWTKVDEPTRQQIEDSLRLFINKLPLKGQ